MKTKIFLLAMLLSSVAFAKSSKSGGNSVVGADGSVQSAKLNCAWEMEFSDYLQKEPNPEFARLARTYNEFTYSWLVYSQVKVCALKGGATELNDLLNLPASGNPQNERVAGYIAGQFPRLSYILLTEKFLNDVANNTEGRNKIVLGQVLMREALHNQLQQKSPNLDWVQRDLAVSGALERINNLKGKEVNRADFQQLNEFLEKVGFRSGFNIHGSLYSENGPGDDLGEFVKYLRLASGKINMEDAETRGMVLHMLIDDCAYKNIRKGEDCVGNFQNAIQILREHGQKLIYNYTSLSDEPDHLEFLMWGLMSHVMTKHGLAVRFSYSDRKSFPDLMSMVEILAKSRDVITFSEDFILAALLRKDFIPIREHFLSLVPFIKVGLVSASTPFSCKLDSQARTNLNDLYFLSANQKSDYAQPVNNILQKELPGVFKYQGGEQNALRVLKEDGCYVLTPTRR